MKKHLLVALLVAFTTTQAQTFPFDVTLQMSTISGVPALQWIVQ